MSTLTIRKAIVAVAVLGLIAAACAQEADDNPLVIAGTPGQQPGEPEQPTAPDDPEVLIPAALEDVDRFWQGTYPEVYGDEWIPIGDLSEIPEIQQNPFVPYGPDFDFNQIDLCGATSYEEIQQNAFYCIPPYDLVAWDEVGLIPGLIEDFSPFTVAIVMAHEFGHGVQARADINRQTTPTLLFEQQADCFAGAWTRWIAEDNSETFAVTEDALDLAIAGFISFSDLPGTAGDDPMAHGSGFDRVGAYQDGYANGAEKCSTYIDDPPQTVEIPFFDPEDAANEGNLHLEDESGNPGLFSLIEPDLNLYYELLFEALGTTWEDVSLEVVAPTDGDVECNGETLAGEDLEFASFYCEDEKKVVLSEDLIYEGFGDAPSLEELGDFAVGTEIGRLYARAAQLQLGIDDGGTETNLQADCLTGVWAAANFPQDESGTTILNSDPEVEERGEEVRLIMSPGDLDESILAFLTYGHVLGGEESGTAFQRAAALRLGFLAGIESCEEEWGDLGG